MTKRRMPPDEELKRLYLDEKMTCKDICRKYGLSPNSSGNIGQKLKSMGVKIRRDAGEYHHAWKGGRIMKGDGYVGIWMPNHERADNQGYVYEHTLVAAKKYGRLPQAGEVVHHINLDKLDNSENNLWLCNNREHLVCHRSIEKLIKPLLEKGIISFCDGEYKVNDGV